MTRTTIMTSLSSITIAVGFSTMALGGAHTWRVHELFSNADGTVQFIELRECCGNTAEHFIGGLSVTSDANGIIHTFASNLNDADDTADRHILLATAGFAGLIGAPAPDHIIPDNSFNPNGDTVRYYGYDDFAFTAGQLPTDCVNSLTKLTVAPETISSGVNSPTNYVGQVGSVSTCTPPGGCEGDIAPPGGNGSVGTPDLLLVINSWGACAGCDADVAPPGGNGTVGTPDLLFIINNWGPCDP